MNYAIYPPVGFHFKVEFDDLGEDETDSFFREVTGITAEFDVETRKEGGENRFVHTFPVRAKYSTVTLKRGLQVHSKLIEWCKKALVNMEITPINIWIYLMNEKHEVLQLYYLINAWPKKWTISDLNAEENQIVVESIELGYQYFNIQYEKSRI